MHRILRHPATSPKGNPGNKFRWFLPTLIPFVVGLFLIPIHTLKSQVTQATSNANWWCNQCVFPTTMLIHYIVHN
jgi:hypothetical protein